MAVPVSVVVGAIGFRIAVEFLGLFFEVYMAVRQSMNMKNKDTWAHRWITKIFLVDLQRDITFYVPSKQMFRN